MISACTTFQAQTPAQKYYALKSDYMRLLAIAVAYKTDCAKRVVADACHAHIKEINTINKHIVDAFKSADKQGLQVAGTGNDIVLVSVSTALQELTDYLTKLEQ
jgi:hypothetical protein